MLFRSIAIRTLAPPTITGLSGITGGGAHYRRDSDVVVISGTNLGTATHVDLVDASGALISGVNPIAEGNLTKAQVAGNAWTITLAAGLFDADGNETDTIASLRTVQVRTAHSNATASGNFTVSATPVFVQDANVTFHGGGYDNATNTYRVDAGDLRVHGVGLNFHGVKTVHFGYGNNGTWTSVPIAHAGLSIDANGTTLFIHNATLQAMVGGDWSDSDGVYNRSLRLKIGRAHV